MPLPILAVVLPTIKAAAASTIVKQVAKTAASSFAVIAGRKAGERLFRNDTKQTKRSYQQANTALAQALHRATVAEQLAQEAEERAETTEQELAHERSLRRILARVVLPVSSLASLSIGILIGWLLIP